jgi:chromate reductase
MRRGSTNTAALRTAQALVSEGATAEMYDGLADLPAFNPDDDRDPLPAAAAELRHRIATSDAILFSTPEYAGALPGSFKNLLDWTVGGGETYGMPVAWVNVASVASPSGAADAHASLRRVLGYTGSEVVEEACVRVPVPRDAIGPDGLVADPEIAQVVADAVAALAGRAAQHD